MSAEAYLVGLVCLSVCASDDMTVEEIEREMNAEYPTGITFRWQLSEDKTFANGDPMPCPCEQSPGRLHYLLNC